ncbi:hypothetical protein NX773_00265 [Massilia solisilvae]|uniref:DUF2845 domain-containing protein n=1 Tax=Massilia solisilvae TaxID=1811225 RepID=A0ABT2BDI8_9BURK|nr:hypothetical protein [Massilia solisilvae]MCS0606596.1 hypothetical protein [Massilia solisilvae]
MLALLLAVNLAPQANAQLCTPDEAVVFSCQVGAKTVSLCRPQGVRGQLAYRFGGRDGVEMSFPRAGTRAAGAGRFGLATTPLFGGGVTRVVFDRGGYRYEVYSKSARADDAERTPYVEDGVIVRRGGKTMWHLVCEDGGAGFREELGWLPRAADTAP